MPKSYRNSSEIINFPLDLDEDMFYLIYKVAKSQHRHIEDEVSFANEQYKSAHFNELSKAEFKNRMESALRHVLTEAVYFSRDEFKDSLKIDSDERAEMFDMFSSWEHE